MSLMNKEKVSYTITISISYIENIPGCCFAIQILSNETLSYHPIM